MSGWRPAGLGQGDAAIVTNEESVSEVVFERADRGAEGGLHDVYACRRPGEMQLVGHCYETPKPQLLVFLGAVLEEASPAEAATVLGAMPRAARLVWRTVGRRIYARRMRRVRG